MISNSRSGAHAIRRLIVGISGASGSIYGLRLLDLLREVGIETHLILTQSATITLRSELDISLADLSRKASVVHNVRDVGASISSGSFITMGMVVAPCSMRTLANIANGNADNLLTRAADVVLKERRRLVLLTRETPLHLGHLKNMVSATEIGAIIMPPVPAFYAKPRTIDDVVEHTVGRVVDLFGIDSGTVQRWKESRS